MKLPRAMAGVLAALALAPSAAGMPTAGPVATVTSAPAAPEPAAAVSRPTRAEPAATHAVRSAAAAQPGPGKDCETMNVVAHEDDDLLFINPAVSADIAAGRCVVTVFLTAGDAGRGTAYWRGREAGALAAYAKMAGGGKWITGRMGVGTHRITRARLSTAPVTLLFLRLPDGHGYAEHDFEKMYDLFAGTRAGIHPVDGAAGYDKDGLTATLTSIMNAYRPVTVRTLDYEGVGGDGDHGDHHAAGYFTYAAQQAYATPHTITGFQGYPITARPVNLSAAETNGKITAFLAYAKYDPCVPGTRKAVLKNKNYGTWVDRRYQIPDRIPDESPDQDDEPTADPVTGPAAAGD